MQNNFNISIFVMETMSFMKKTILYLMPVFIICVVNNLISVKRQQEKCNSCLNSLILQNS